MKPDTKSKYFKLSLFCFAAHFIHLFVLQYQVRNVILHNIDGENLPTLYYYLPYIWVAIAGLLFFKATKKKQSLQNQIMAFILTPLILSPILGIIYVIIVLLPIYEIAGQSISR